MQRSQGLIITMIVFIILSLTLGIVSYFIKQKNNEMNAELNSAKEAAENAKQSIKTLNDQLDSIKKKVGYEKVPVDQVLQNMDKDIKMAMGNATRVPQDYRNAVLEIGRNLSDKNKEIATYKTQNLEYRVLADNEIKKTKVQKDTYDQQRKNSETTYQKQKTDDKKRLDDWEGEYKKLTQKVDAIELEAKALNDKYRLESADAKEAAAKIAGINTQLSTKLDELSQTEFDVQDGNILYVNQNDKTARLNIGKLDSVRLLTRFGVYPPNTLDLGRAVPKGSVEIVRILGDHESEAKIIEDEMSNPVMPGDMIYTPLWKVGEQVYFALGYHLDVDGDGKTDTELLKDLIEANGSHVALWMDDDGTVHGRMSSAITSIITSDTPVGELFTADQTKEQKIKDQIQTTYMKLLEEARLNNVRDVKLAEFLRRVHFRKSADVQKYQEQGGVKSATGTSVPTFSDTPIAPIYVNKPHEKPPVSSGIVSPRYKGGKSQPAPVSPGKVSDYYFRKRNP
ncbi:MAG: hypothetical protein Q4G69_10635 [Planctomycetia bacterium]|nr:hypothetical protein [Planctomycetia bacterium]